MSGYNIILHKGVIGGYDTRGAVLLSATYVIIKLIMANGSSGRINAL